MSVSANVVILTLDELEAIKNEAFKSGVKRGRFEAAADYARTATTYLRQAENDHNHDSEPLPQGLQ